MITRDQIQSVVDGECSDALRAALLREIESKPAEWRTLALALLEEQQWSKQIAALGSDHASSHIIPSSASWSLDAASVELPGRLSRGPSSGAFPWMTTLAASLLFGLGIFGGSYLPNLRSLDSEGGDTIALAKNPIGTSQAESIDESSMRVGNLDTEMKMLVSGPNKETAEIPIYDLKAMDHDVIVARELYEVARINQRLRKEGFELDVRPEYYTGKLNDGRQLIVPVKHVGFKPYGL